MFTLTQNFEIKVQKQINISKLTQRSSSVITSCDASHDKIYYAFNARINKLLFGLFWEGGLFLITEFY